MQNHHETDLGPPLLVVTDLLLRKHPAALTVASAEWIVFWRNAALNCFISQAPVLVKTLDLAGFTLRSGRDTSADHRPGNRNLQDSQQFPTFLPGWTHLGMGTKACP